jgi:hypothetical protein
MPSTIRRQIFLDHRRAQIDLPRLMTDEQLATKLEEFLKEVRGASAEGIATRQSA